METLAETGVVGLALLVSFVLVVLGAAVSLCQRSRYEARVRAAGVTGALIAFLVAASSDWIWQVPAVPAAFFVLAGAVLAPSVRRRRRAVVPLPRAILSRIGVAVIAVACLVAIAVPLATTNAVRSSQTAAVRPDHDRGLTPVTAARASDRRGGGRAGLRGARRR